MSPRLLLYTLYILILHIGVLVIYYILYCINSLQALYDNGFPVPTPVDFNRHCVIMELMDAYPL